MRGKKSNFNEYGIDINCLDKDGYNINGVDKDGVDKDGFNINNVEGIRKIGYMMVIFIMISMDLMKIELIDMVMIYMDLI